MALAFGATLTIGASAFAQTQVHASTPAPIEPVYRLYNPNTGEHFYTVTESEAINLFNAGWNEEGVGFTAALTGTPVYRVYNPNVPGGDHYYTESKYEAQSLVSQGWRWDNGGKPVFYSNGGTNLYVAYNPNALTGTHNYTTNSVEESSLVSAGWKNAKVAWKVEGTGFSTDSGYIGNVENAKGQLVWLQGGFSSASAARTAADQWGRKHFSNGIVFYYGSN